MVRTTIDIDPGVLRELKLRQRGEGKSLGALVSDLLAKALKVRDELPAPDLRWTTAPMHALVDLDDKEAMERAIG